MKVAVNEYIITNARTLRRDMTEAEKKLWGILSNRQMNGVKFRRQVPLGAYIADFASHEAKLIIEVDGGQHAENAEKDDERTAFVQGEGYRVLRFWNNEVLENLEGVYAVIERTFRELDVVES